MEYAFLVSLVSLLVSIYSLNIIRINYRDFAKQEFVKKQIQVIIDLVTHLHNEKIEFTFATISGFGSGGNYYYLTLFEISDIELPLTYQEYYSNPIQFHSDTNQLLDIKRFIDNPFLPKSIADQLENFYSRRSTEIKFEEIDRKN